MVNPDSACTLATPRTRKLGVKRVLLDCVKPKIARADEQRTGGVQPEH